MSCNGIVVRVLSDIAVEGATIEAFTTTSVVTENHGGELNITSCDIFGFAVVSALNMHKLILMLQQSVREFID